MHLNGHCNRYCFRRSRIHFLNPGLRRAADHEVCDKAPDVRISRRSPDVRPTVCTLEMRPVAVTWTLRGFARAGASSPLRLPFIPAGVTKTSGSLGLGSFPGCYTSRPELKWKRSCYVSSVSRHFSTVISVSVRGLAWARTFL